MKNGESVYLSPLSDPLEPAPHESSKLAMDIATNNLPIIRPDVTAIPLSNKSKIKKKKTKPSDPRQSRMSPHVILQQLKDGIDSNDTDTIFRILEENDVKLVNETVQNMPVEFVSRLLEFLKKKICRKTVKTANSLLWLEQLLQSKLTFLLSVSRVVHVLSISTEILLCRQLPGAKSAIAPLSETLNTRIEVFDCVLKLKGRLNLLTAQVTVMSAIFVLTLSHSYQASEKAREQKPQTNISGKAAIVEFEDSSGDEAQECFAVESFATNQLSLSGIGPGSSDEEVDEPDSDDGETQDIEYD